MSETVRYTGKLKLVEKLNNETLEEQCKKILEECAYSKLNDYCDSWEEMLCDELYDEYVICNDKLYEILEKNSQDTDCDIFESYDNGDGTISYEVMYYNGGCGFAEAIEYALDNLE